MTMEPQIQFVLLDIEGTTCPASFVGDVLFPYASKQMLSYLCNHQAETDIRRLLAEIHTAWQQETDPEAIELAKQLTQLSTPITFNTPRDPGKSHLASRTTNSSEPTEVSVPQGIHEPAGIRRPTENHQPLESTHSSENDNPAEKDESLKCCNPAEHMDQIEVTQQEGATDPAAFDKSTDVEHPENAIDTENAFDKAENNRLAYPYHSTSKVSKESATDLQALSAEHASLYLNWLIKKDRKLTALKDLQGLIWEEGYRKGNLIAPLFADVPDALRNWHQQGLQLGVYSSGSVKAQKLLYAHTSYGDLSHLFSNWFDTHTGPKNSSASYLSIASTLCLNPETILFISDSPAELSAARATRFSVLHSDRPGNPHHNYEDFPSIQSFSEINISKTP